MNYKKHYDSLMSKSSKRGKLNVYQEEHHIIPKCLGGSDEQSNLVFLTPEEHFIAHKLLTKIHPNNLKILYAFNFMSSPISGRKIDNKKFGFVRKQISEMMKGEMNPIKRFPEKNHFLKNHYPRIVSEFERKNLSKRMKENNPMKGKLPWEHSRSTAETIEIWKNANNYYEYWKNQKCSYQILAKQFGYEKFKSSHINMIKMFRRGWIPEKDQKWRQLNESNKI
ncbi:putative endonuclease [Synechococcus phage DSL-LC02]|nr:putative endonuclease [Synechococcus phage DSL-LC02]